MYIEVANYIQHRSAYSFPACFCNSASDNRDVQHIEAMKSVNALVLP